MPVSHSDKCGNASHPFIPILRNFVAHRGKVTVTP
jgi:hypothetical protein